MCVEWMKICGEMSDMDVCGVYDNMWGNELHGCVWSRCEYVGE